MCTTMNNSRGRPFGPDGCQVQVGQGTCGETRTLDIINEFKRLYEEKMHQIDTAGGGDCLQEKVKLQQEWISDLSDQNEMLVRAVEELEHEATERVRLLEDKLQKSAQCLCEVMKRYRDYDVTNDLLAEPLQKMFCLENDQKNLLEFIRRIREEKQWSVDGLKFFDIAYKDLFGPGKKEKDCSTVKCKNECSKNDSVKEQEKTKEKESVVKQLELQIDYFKSFGNVESMASELKCKREECENLKTCMADNQQALVEEIAAKHDQIMQLKRDCQQLEERCIQADKQTAFRDDIIKELRKEIKQLKQQGDQEQREEIQSLLEQVLILCCMTSETERTTLMIRAKSLERRNGCLECTLKEDKEQINKLEKKFQQFLKDKEQLKQKHKDMENKHKCVSSENENLKTDIEYLKKMISLAENDLKSAQEGMENFKNKSDNYDVRILELTQENEKIMTEMVELNKENRNLLKTIDNLKLEKDNPRKLTQEEVIKLKCTIEDLQFDLQKTKEVREEEEARNQANMSKLNNTLQMLQSALKETEEKCERVKHGLNQAEDKYEKMKSALKHSEEKYEKVKFLLKELEEKYKKDVKACKICKGRSKVGFLENAEVQVYLDDEHLQKQMEALEQKDEIIKVQNNTLDIMQQELLSLKQAEFDVRNDRDLMYREIQSLKEKVADLKGELRDSDGKAANLQMAVDLYLNTINVLEASEEKHKLEIDNQKSTISNLQKALVATKHELDELKHRSDENQHQQETLVSHLNGLLLDAEYTELALVHQHKYILEEYGYLQELNYGLEVEHCSSLQDIDLLENQLYKYQTLLKSSEETIKQYKIHLKKLLRQKKSYEEVIGYFKEEITVMAAQLCNLQELLTISNESTQEEANKLMQAFMNVRSLNDQLSTQLSAAEQKVVLENQMNQLHEAKINELQQIISERDLDLTRHDEAILNIRRTLQCSLHQNDELQSTIVALQDTIAPLQEAIEKYEMDNCKSREGTEACQTQITTCREKLEELKGALDKRTSELFKLEMAYNNQNRALKSAQIELKQMKERQKNKQCHMKCTIEALRDKLVKAEENCKKMEEECSKLQAQLAAVVRKEGVKDMEVKRYRNIVGDLRNTLIDLNKSLTNREVQAPRHQEGKCKNAECKKNMKLAGEGKTLTDVCLNCPCEVEFYQSIVETLKKSVIDLKRKLTETQQRNKQLEEESKRKEARLAEISKTHLEKDKEYQDLRKKLMDKLKQAQAEETRYLEMAAQFEKELSSVRQELEVKNSQLNEVKKSAQEINSSRCMQLACAQEEVNNLRDELNGLVRKHRALNAENEKLHSQSARMQSTVTTLEERSQLLKGQLEQYLAELQNVQSEKETLMRKNRELLTELRSIQGSCAASDKQQRYTTESVKALESEMDAVRNNRDEICCDVKNVVGYVRAWLQEQRKINEYTVRRERNYCNTIRRLKYDYEEIQCQNLPPCQRPCTRVLTPCLKASSPPPMCQSPWSLGSQGTTSVHDIHSPSRSPYPEEHNDWYSTTFRNESEEEEGEEDWVSKVENLAAQVRRTNRMWKNKMGQPDYGVSRDTKK